MGILAWSRNTNGALRGEEEGEGREGMTVKGRWQRSDRVTQLHCVCSPAVQRQATHRPVVVQVTHLVSKPLKVVWFESRGVGDDVVVGGSNSALTDRLAHNEKVIPSTSERER